NFWDSILTCGLVFGVHYTLLVNQLESIEDGIEFIGSAINTRLHASRYLFEAKQFNQLNVAPFSRLHLFYEAFVNLFERLITNFNDKVVDDGPTFQFKFLIDVAIHSSVDAKLFVPNIGCKSDLSRKLIGITINEHSFFQTKNTLIFLLHEIGHYTRPFDREKRNQVFLATLNNWIENLVFHELTESLGHEPLFSEKEEKVKSHFETEVILQITPIIRVILESYFAEFTKLTSFTEKFGNRNPYLGRINDFNSILNAFIKSLSVDLSTVLLTTSKETLQERLKRSKINSLKGLSLSQEDEAGSYFDGLCDLATTLFEENRVFGYKLGKGNSNSNRAFDLYLQWLSILGLNEASEKNFELFIENLLQMLKKALEITEIEGVLETLRRNLNEALADVFIIRTLDIQSFENYQKIIAPILERESYGKLGQLKFFGSRFSIIMEYFRLINPDITLNYPTSDTPQTDFGILYQSSTYELSSADKVTLANDLRELWFEPIAEYLSSEASVFPETTFYDIKDGDSLSEEGKQILFLRNYFKEGGATPSFQDDFSKEMQIIDFFSKT
ncbi:MAG: hypothetical protein HN392_10150, partial [Anaerolineae bacterium]|nr:hypothetical protein [Anaerolineae bacterium]